MNVFGDGGSTPLHVAARRGRAESRRDRRGRHWLRVALRRGIPIPFSASARTPPASRSALPCFAARVASAVAVMPLTSGSFGSAGRAVIPFDLPSTLARPGARRASAAKALTTCGGECLDASSNDRRSVFPSTAVASDLGREEFGIDFAALADGCQTVQGRHGHVQTGFGLQVAVAQATTMRHLSFGQAAVLSPLVSTERSLRPLNLKPRTILPTQSAARSTISHATALHWMADGAKVWAAVIRQPTSAKQAARKSRLRQGYGDSQWRSTK